MNIFSRNTLIIVLLAGLVAAGVWWGLPSNPSTDVLNTEVVAGPDQELINNLISLRTVTLSGTIFSDPAFMSLNDVGVEIVDEPVGRRNPFAPLTVGGTQLIAVPAPIPVSSESAPAATPSSKKKSVLPRQTQQPPQE